MSAVLLSLVMNKLRSKMTWYQRRLQQIVLIQSCNSYDESIDKKWQLKQLLLTFYDDFIRETGFHFRKEVDVLRWLYPMTYADGFFSLFWRGCIISSCGFIWYIYPNSSGLLHNNLGYFNIALAEYDNAGILRTILRRTRIVPMRKNKPHTYHIKHFLLRVL